MKVSDYGPCCEVFDYWFNVFTCHKPSQILDFFLSYFWWFMCLRICLFHPGWLKSQTIVQLSNSLFISVNVYFIYLGLFGDCVYNCYKLLMHLPFKNIQCPSLSLITGFDLKSSLYDIIIASHLTFFWSLFALNIFPLFNFQPICIFGFKVNLF